jgi:phosphoglycolate phosphatase-like HAD superfamily hydrolase
MKKKHIIFDMDGTLADTAKVTAAAFYEVCGKYDLPKLEYKKISDAIGIGGLDFYISLYPGQPAELLSGFAREVEDCEKIKTKELGEDILFPGIPELLRGLLKDGCNLYIASTGDKNHVYSNLTAGNIIDLFAGISCGEPEKEAMVKRIIAERDITEWAMVGDRNKDSNAARANNILALGAKYGYLNEEDFGLFDAVLYKPGDIYDYI